MSAQPTTSREAIAKTVDSLRSSTSRSGRPAGRYGALNAYMVAHNDLVDDHDKLKAAFVELVAAYDRLQTEVRQLRRDTFGARADATLRRALR